LKRVVPGLAGVLNLGGKTLLFKRDGGSDGDGGDGDGERQRPDWQRQLTEEQQREAFSCPDCSTVPGHKRLEHILRHQDRNGSRVRLARA
jgi:hypothetical protein